MKRPVKMSKIAYIRSAQPMRFHRWFSSISVQGSPHLRVHLLAESFARPVVRQFHLLSVSVSETIWRAVFWHSFSAHQQMLTHATEPSVRC